MTITRYSHSANGTESTDTGRTRIRRSFASAGAVLAAAMATAVALPLTAAAATGTVITEGTTLTLRASATTSGTALANIPSQTSLTISCQTDGPSITGPYGATTVWDKVSYGGQTGYVSDAWIYTGSNGRVAPECAGGGGDTPPPASGSRSDILAAAMSKLGVEEDPPGSNCTEFSNGTGYGCVEWCALFATWAWNQGGISTPRVAFTGDIHTWAASSGRLIDTGNSAATVLANARPGDMVLYGTGPSTPGTSWHVDIVQQNTGSQLNVIGGNVSIGNDGVRQWSITNSSSYSLSDVYAIISAG